MHYTNPKKHSDFGSFLVGKDATQFEILGGLFEAEPLPPAVIASLETNDPVSPLGARSRDPTWRGHVIKPLPNLSLAIQFKPESECACEASCLFPQFTPPPSPPPHFYGFK
jgi:hypothetical protein